MISCDIGNHSTYQIIRHFDIDLYNKKVIHVGAHNALEFDIFQSLSVSRVDWFECNKYVYPELLQRLNKHPRHHPHFVCLTDKDDDEREYHVYRDKKDGASGLFLPDKMNEYVDCRPTGESWKVKTITYDTYAKDVGLPNDYYFLVLDIQGGELSFLQKATTLLNQPSLQWLYVEVSKFPCYQDAPQESEITEYLKEKGFNLLGYRDDWNIGPHLHGDNIYFRSIK